MDDLLILPIAISTLLIATVTGILYFQYKDKKKVTNKESHALISINHIPVERKEKEAIIDEDGFISLIANKYKTYEDFLVSQDFDDYFTYWDSHPNSMEKVKTIITANKTKLN